MAGFICANVTSESRTLITRLPKARAREDGARFSIWKMDSPPVWHRPEMVDNSTSSIHHFILIQSQNYMFMVNHHDHRSPAENSCLAPGL